LLVFENVVRGESQLLHCTEQDLGLLNTLGLPARAISVQYQSADELMPLSELARRYRSVFVLGGGSNVVLAQYINALVVRVVSRGIQVEQEHGEDVYVRAQAGEPWHDFVAYCLSRGWFGLENLALIPGTAGAAPVQNIGAYGMELDQCVHSVQAWDIRQARQVSFSAAQCEFSYRDSLFKRAPQGQWLITSVCFRLSRRFTPRVSYPDLLRHPGLQAAGSELTAQQVFDAVCSIRRSKLPDPARLGNAGSFFKNPVVDAATYARLRQTWPDCVAYPQPDGHWKLAAGWLIDQAGWKGYREGPVGVHERQALVLVNYGGAVASDILELAAAIQEDIRQKYGVQLEREPVLVE
jgi:UDP-N-acetylmuramate dehydrogenase